MIYIINLNVFPAQVSVAFIGRRIEVISSKHSDIIEDSGVSVLHTRNILAIDIDSEVNLIMILNMS